MTLIFSSSMEPKFRPSSPLSYSTTRPKKTPWIIKEHPKFKTYLFFKPEPIFALYLQQSSRRHPANRPHDAKVRVS